MVKKYQIKIYGIDGTYIKTFNPNTIIGDVRFTSKINGGLGECSVELNLPIDDFDEGDVIDHMKFVRIYEIDATNSPQPRLIYTGFISQYTPFVRGATQGVRLILLGLVSLLSNAYYKNGTSYTVTHTTQDPEDIVKSIIDHFNTVYTGSWIGYSGGNTTPVGTTITYEFEDKKWIEAIAKAYDLSGEDRWWMIREDGELWFMGVPSTATHRFTLGKDVDIAEVEKNSERVVNTFQLRYNDPVTTKDFTDATSETKYGKREKIQTDQRITTANTRDQRGNQEIEDNKDAKVSGTLRINSNYDIESIKPGDTCSVFNSKKNSVVFPENMLITSVSYTPDYVSLSLEEKEYTLADELTRVVKSIESN